MPAIKGGYIEFERPEYDRPSRPVDPGWGVEGPVDPGYGRPGGGRPGQLPSYGERPVDPGFGNWPARPVDPGWGVGEAGPGQLPVFPSHGTPGQLPILPDKPPKPPGGENKPVYPGGGAGQLPVFPATPEHPLPPYPGQPLPPVDMPPGTIWPPLEPDAGLPPQLPDGKAIVVCGIPGVGWRYVVVTIPPKLPGQGLPGQPPAAGQLPSPGSPLPRR